jgi:prepilin-type N-terminal cleavage/methylation domain-containing protein
MIAKNQGFTLVELLIGVGIVAIMRSIIVPALYTVKNKTSCLCEQYATAFPCL